MQKKNHQSVGIMAQRCHKWRQKWKQLREQARTTNDEIEREKILQAAEHYGRMVNDEQSKIDQKRGPRERDETPEITYETDLSDDDDITQSDS